MLKGAWKEYFSFSKKERNAVFILLFVIALIIVLPYFVPSRKLELSIDENLQQQLDRYQQQHPEHTNYVTSDSIPSSDTSHQTKTAVKLFQFDPNTLPEAGFKQLGLSDKVIHTIINYRTKGGYFKTPQDIKKIYGLSVTDAQRLMPYIKIASTNNNTAAEKQTVQKPVVSNNSYHTININTATAEEWKSLPGIGDVLGNRIVKFRNSMGGFKSIDDVKKTYGLKDSTFNLIHPYLILK